MKVFLSWSGEKSQRVAVALREWLPYINTNLDPFISSKDIDPGSRWQAEIAEELGATSYGIICVTRENQAAPWLNYEVGALTYAVDKSHVVPLAIDLKPSDIKPPLGHFQAMSATREDIYTIARSINELCERSSKDLEKAFEKWWPDLEGQLDAIAKDVPAPAGDTRTERELLEETLDLVRGLARVTADVPSATDAVQSKPSRRAAGPRPEQMPQALSAYQRARKARERQAARKQSGGK